jgi:hypothetical protein
VASGTTWEGGAPGDTAFVQTYNGDTWTVVTDQQLSGYASGDDMAGVSCVSSTFCAAAGTAGDRGDVGGLVDVDTSGTWTGTQIVDDRSESTFPSPVVGISSVACAANDLCVAPGPTGYIFGYDGTGWTEEASDPAATGTASSCPDATTCLVVTSDGDLVVDQSGNWLPPRSIDPGADFVSLSCPTPRFCLAADRTGQVLIGRS